jgi:hypothetical protein
MGKVIKKVTDTGKARRAAIKKMKGYLKEYANPVLIPEEKNAWETNVKEKYGNF